MSPSERDVFDEQREAYHATFLIRTPQLVRTQRIAERKLRANAHHSFEARSGLILDSEAGRQGKTTIMRAIGRWWYCRELSRYPDRTTASGHEFCPVARVELGARPSLTKLNAAFGKFFNLPPLRGTLRDGTDPVCEVLNNCGTSLVLIDDVSALKLSRIDDTFVNDHFKSLMNAVPATFILAGINCRNGGLLADRLSDRERSFSQTSGRFVRIAIEPFRLQPRARADEWIALLKKIESELVLMNSFPGMLEEKLRLYLFERTRGEIGHLMDLVREGAVAAMLDGTERLTESLLDEIPLPFRVDPDPENRAVTKSRRRRRGRR